MINYRTTQWVTTPNCSTDDLVVKSVPNLLTLLTLRFFELAHFTEISELSPLFSQQLNLRCRSASLLLEKSLILLPINLQPSLRKLHIHKLHLHRFHLKQTILSMTHPFSQFKIAAATQHLSPQNIIISYSSRHCK
jgi:hypothetical protein